MRKRHENLHEGRAGGDTARSEKKRGGGNFPVPFQDRTRMKMILLVVAGDADGGTGLVAPEEEVVSGDRVGLVDLVVDVVAGGAGHDFGGARQHAVDVGAVR